ncbi:alpha-xenorhabdolysin family binary toxin subunit A [Pseudomonas sp. CFBP 13711]|uniref:alpha-xenorhabdolysin family binary toxin subunit A n=1 Tax=unclassified Pseudomonas TaxID=196821 RepID=UPI00177B0C65|nr:MULTISPECIES: alpha-xenorhabdolysin family binary toxin subunit A [unclassified Pseudomonas]MBD8705944.1 alpha-xenorhabdolysin family binary toxin subunit A [Pseudomonas sp. CFBP 13711]MBD8710357.1 alpha-xenorhabdolysin family binary toxin subunit A [Pseudomonas sp. CFBP 13715]
MSQLTENLVTDAASDPASLFGSSVATNGSDTRDTGLILTKEQLKHLKKYEIAGLALPTELDNVIAYLGYENGAGLGLEPVDFQRTFKLVNGHARLWNPLRTDLLTVNTKLVVFAGSMQVYGASMREVFDDMAVLGLIEKYNIKTLEDLRKVELKLGKKFPGIEAMDRLDLGFYLDEILKKVREQEAEALAIKQRLDSFGRQLAQQVGPAIKLKLASIDNNTMSSEIQARQVKIDNRALAIEEKNKEYKEMVKQAIGAVMGNLVMMIYSSVQAEKIRKERNKLTEEQEKDIALMAKKNRILASLGRIRMDFQNLDLIVIDADIATQNLISVWNSLSTFIAASAAEVDGIHDGLSMRRFRNQFNLVVKPWETIEVDAQKLQHVFAEADREFREDYGV